MFKQEIISLLAKETRLRKEEIENLIEIPPKEELGDYAFPCFILSKKEKKSPNQIAEHISKTIKKQDFLEKVESNGPYLNFFINKGELAKNILKINSNYGKSPIGKKHKIVIDFSSPNIGKPMHVGHIRSTILGDSLMRIFDYLEYNPIGINYLGDIGLHIGKLIVAYELWLNKEGIKKDSVAELLRLYVKFCSKEKSEVKQGEDEEIEEFSNNPWTLKAKDKLRLLELGDKKTHKIWQEIQKYSQKGFDKVYDLLKIEFNETTGQSKFSEKGKSIIKDAILKDKAKSEPSGAVYIELEKKGEKEKQKKYILRTGSIASYMTQDLGAAVERFEKYKFDRMIYLTDYRQKQHFIDLFTILNKFGYNFTDKLIHLPFGTVKFGDEILATRQGNLILLEEVLKKTIDKAKKEIQKRKTKGNPQEVGIASIKYSILKNEPTSDVQFSWEQALNFEGNTGPYLQYSYARASSIIKKAKKGNFNKKLKKFPEIKSQEFSLIKKINEFPEIVQNAGKNLSPNLIANYSFELAKSFNEFYVNCRVVGEEKTIEAFRLLLIESFRTTLKNALYLLGIEVMEEM